MQLQRNLNIAYVETIHWFLSILKSINFESFFFGSLIYMKWLPIHSFDMHRIDPVYLYNSTPHPKTKIIWNPQIGGWYLSFSFWGLFQEEKTVRLSVGVVDRFRFRFIIGWFINFPWILEILYSTLWKLMDSISINLDLLERSTLTQWLLWTFFSERKVLQPPKDCHSNSIVNLKFH